MNNSNYLYIIIAGFVLIIIYLYITKQKQQYNKPDIKSDVLPVPSKTSFVPIIDEISAAPNIADDYYITL